jgi:hypothetical protein
VPHRLHYYPISFGQYGLAIFHAFLKTGQSEKKEHFLRIADWWVNNAIIDGKLGAYWLTEVSKPEYRMTEPWKSAFTQRRAFAYGCSAWQLIIGHIILTCHSALKPFTDDISVKGVTAHLRRRPFSKSKWLMNRPMVVVGSCYIVPLFDFVQSVTLNI